MIVDLQNHEPAFLNLTKTMLEKSTIDANVSIRNFSKLFGADYAQMKAGDKVIFRWYGISNQLLSNAETFG